MKKVIFWVVGIGVVLVGLVWGEQPDGNLRLVACDVGQGDAVLLTQNFNQVLIDGGRANGRVLDCLSRHMPFWDREIELVVMTHPQEDHFGGLKQVVERYQVRRLLASDAVNDIESFWEWFELVKNEEIEVLEADMGQMISLGEMELEVLWPEDEVENSFVWDLPVAAESEEYSQILGVQSVLETQEEDVNDESVVLRLAFGGASGLFTGDIGKGVEEELMRLGLVEKVDVLKVAHHGSKNSSYDGFLQVVDPEFSLIQSGENNRYGHPHDLVISALEKTGTVIFRNDEDGEVVLVTDGGEWWVE